MKKKLLCLLGLLYTRILKYRWSFLTGLFFLLGSTWFLPVEYAYLGYIFIIIGGFLVFYVPEILKYHLEEDQDERIVVVYENKVVQKILKKIKVLEMKYA